MAQENEWMKVCSSPKSAKEGKKHLEDYLDESGRYWSTPSTPTGQNRLSREPSFDSAQISQEKPNIMTKVHEKARKWKQVLPYIKKHLHGHSHENEQRQRIATDKGMSTISVGLGDEARNSGYLGAPSREIYGNYAHPRTLYESEIAQKRMNKQQSMPQQRSVMDSPPRGPSQVRFATSPTQLTRCKSYRPRPGVKSEIEEVQVQDMTRTTSDPTQLKPVQLGSSEYQPASFSFPTSPEIQELDDSEQTLSSNRKFDQTRYSSSLSPRFVGNNPSSLSPRLVINTHDNTPRASETRLSSSSNSRLIYQNGSNEMTFTDYNIIVEEINEILDSPSSLSSNITHKKTDSIEMQFALDHQQHNSKVHQGTYFPSPLELNRYDKIANFTNNGKDTETNPNESPTYKVLSEVANKISNSQVATNQGLELNGTSDRLKVSFAPTATKPRDELDHNKFEDPRTTHFDDSNVASKVAKYTRIQEATNKDSESTQQLGMNVSSQVSSKVTSQFTGEIISQTCSTNSKGTDKMVGSSQKIAETQPQEVNSISLAIVKPVNLKPIATKIETNQPKRSKVNPINHDDYKTVTEAVTEILTPAYHAVSEAAGKIVESAKNGTKKVAKSLSDDNYNPNIDASDNGDYKTVTEAVGEMFSPVYSAVSQATNKVAGKGYLSFRDYLKSLAVVGNTGNNDYSLIKNEEVPSSPVPISKNPHTEEREEDEANGRRLQLSAN